MRERLIWFVLGAAIASVFWPAVLQGIGRQWYDALLKLSG